MADTKISAATDTTPPLATDMLPLARLGDNTARKITVGNFLGNIPSGISIPALTAGKGPMVVSFKNDNVYVGIPDPSLYIGYNQNANGVLILPAENALSLGFEADYNDGTGHNKMETYIQYVSADGTISRRLFMWQIDRVTDLLTGASIAGGSELDLCLIDGTGSNSEKIVGRLALKIANNSLAFYPLSAAANQFTLVPATGQPTVLSLGFGVSDTFVISPSSRNNVSIAVDGANSGAVSRRANSLWIYGFPQGGTGDSIAVGVNDNGAVATFAMNAAADLKGVVVRAQAAGTSNLQEWQNSSSVALSVMNRAGVFLPVQAVTTSAPAYVKGGMYFDTTVNKLRIGGATAWETVTSA